MSILGKTNSLIIAKKTDFGLFLDGGTLGEILLPNRYVKPEMTPGDSVKVFIYLDGEERYIATTQIPFAEVGEVAYMKVNAVEKVGAFLDWGIMKDILVPYSEQKVALETGKYYIVYLYVDTLTDRITASMKLEKFIHKTPPLFHMGDKVSAIVVQASDLAFKCVINNSHFALLYKNEVFKPLTIGQKLDVFVKKIREDQKIDITISPQGIVKIDPIGEQILQKLKQNKGFLPFHDKTDAEIIYRQFGISKKAFKVAIGSLYKKREIIISPNGISIAK